MPHPPTGRPHRALAATVALVAVLAACSGDGSAPAAPGSPPRTTAVHATIGTVKVVSARPLVELSEADRAAVLAAVEEYVHDATIAPITGVRSRDLTELLAPMAAAGATGADGDALADAGAPRAVGRVDATLQPVDMTALGDENGAIDLVGTTLDLVVSARAATGKFSIHRRGELMFVRDGQEWKILGFTLAVERGGTGLGGATSTSTGSTP